MLNEKWLSAYHEGGHCAMGRYLNAFSVEKAKIFEDADGEWQGESRIDLTGRTDVERAAIALGGMLAEARVKTTAGESILRIAGGNELTTAVSKFIKSINRDGLAVDEVPIPMVFYAGAFQYQKANLTRSDTDGIPLGVQDNDIELAKALKLAADHINETTEWAMVRQAAERIYAGAPNWVTKV
jgi:hypothetical protein